ncbi:MAG TPA: sigma-70 family RNA polymerase sigma factor [Anaerohalosphaeraceae bacterium]|nr:sigma-70 family RNA polymerase sigma factor [Anaerohalosphaeraceae bacterium]
MLDEKILVWQFNRGSTNALCKIYQRYKNELFGLALSLLHDQSSAEDAVHDVFVRFAQTAGRFRLRRSLKGYLCVCTANRARDILRSKARSEVSLDEQAAGPDETVHPEKRLIQTEESRRLQEALEKLPYEQREVILFHLHQELSFREIASVKNVSVNTIQSRYRYGIEKMRTFLTEGIDHELSRKY